MLGEEIKKLVEEYYEDTIKHRRHLHQYPELSFQEKRTSDYIANQLASLGISFERKADTGIIAILKGTNASLHAPKVIALRADMDALPIQEMNDVAYKSRNSGVMHACGHDVHTASLLSVVRILQRLKDEFSGTIKFIFQPAEEKIPGGAKKMIEEGVLEDPSPKYVLGQHTMPELQVGKVGFHSGNYMASSDELYITVKGKGGHGAMPHLNIDPVTIACQLISSLQQVISRMAKPQVSSALSFGKLIADGAANVIPDEVKIEGTFRTTDEDWRQRAHEKIERLVYSTIEGFGASCEFELRKGYPVLFNDNVLTKEMKAHAASFLGRENVVELDTWMAAEDFAYYSKERPSCFYRLGTGNKEKGINSALHTPTFDVDEKSLKVSIGLMTYLTLKKLKENDRD